MDVGARRTRAEIETIIQRGAGRMPGFPTIQSDDIRGVVDYLLGGERIRGGEVCRGPGAAILPYRFTGYQKFLDPEGYPAVAPPWGTLSAIDLNTGKYAWQIPLGEYPELAAKGMKDTGTENYGGPIVTAGGLLFIGATNFDRKFRAFDRATGKLLWETTLPFSGNATPATYQVGGRQFVAIAAGGGKGRRGEPSGGTYVAFALPARAAALRRPAQLARPAVVTCYNRRPIAPTDLPDPCPPAGAARDMTSDVVSEPNEGAVARHRRAPLERSGARGPRERQRWGVRRGEAPRSRRSSR